MHLTYIVSLFKEKPINTQVTEVSSELSEFPSVTICRTYSVLAEYSFVNAANQPLEKFDGRTLNNFINILYLYINSIFFVVHKQKYLQYLESVRRTEWRRIFYAVPFNLTFEIPDILVFCEFNGIKCNFLHFKKHVHPNYYNCFTFDVEKFLKSNSLALSSNKIDFQIIINTFGGVGGADNGIKTLAADSSFQLEIHPPGTRPSLTENVILDSSERLLQINVRKSEHNKMYLEKRPCFQNLVGQKHGYEMIAPMTNFSDPSYYQTAFKEKFAKFTRNDCINDEWQKIFYRKCNCFSPLLPVSRYVIDHVLVNSTSPLSWCTDSNMMTEYLKIYDVYVNYTENPNEVLYYYYYITKDGKIANLGEELNGTHQMDIMECLVQNINKKENLEFVNKVCPFFCYQESYDMDAKFFKWETNTENSQSLQKYLSKEAEAIKLLLNQSSNWENFKLNSYFLRYIARRLTHINVIYDLSKKSIISEEETYPLINLSSDIGGILGLWIGISILVMAEFFVICKAIVSTCFENHEENVDKDSAEKFELKKVKKSEIISLFLSTTSFHGINHLVATKNVYYRLFWIFVIFLSLVGLGANIEKVVSLFLSKPISIELKYNLDLEEFPAISFCPSTIVSAFYIDYIFSNDKRIPIPYHQLMNDYIEPIWTQLYESQQKKFENNPKTQIFLDSTMQLVRESSIRHTLMGYIMKNNLSFLTRMNSFDLVFGCEYSFENCSFSNFQLQYHPIYKMCFTFRNSETNQRLGYPEYLSLLLLSNDLNSNYSYNTKSINLFRGGYFEIHPYQTFPTMKRPHYFTYATRQIITILKTVDKVMNSNLYPCYNNEDELITLVEEDIRFNNGSQEFNYKYSIDLCEQLVIQNEIFRSCGCVSSMLPLSKEQKNLFSQPHKCAEIPLEIFNSSLKINRQNVVYLNNSMMLDQFINLFDWGKQFSMEFDCHSRIFSNESVKIKAINQCVYLCNKVSYRIRISQNRSPFFYERHRLINAFNDYILTLEKINKSIGTIIPYYVQKYVDTEKVFDYLSGFHFYFESSESKVISQSEGYSLIGMLSDLGGVLGLWFGISVATLFELIELTVLLVYFRN